MLCRTLGLTVSVIAIATAQQAIVNVPSADVTPKGRVLLLHETQLRTWRPDRFWNGGNYFTYGVGKSTEIAVTNWNLGVPAVDNLAMGVGFKSAIPLSRENSSKWHEWDPRLIVGQMTVFPMREGGVGTMAYTLLSARVGPMHTRVTAGAVGGTRHILRRDTVAFAGAVEQPLSRKWAAVTEWSSGANDNGFLIPAVVYTPTPKQMIVVGYRIPNVAENGPGGIILVYGRYF